MCNVVIRQMPTLCTCVLISYANHGIYIKNVLFPFSMGLNNVLKWGMTNLHSKGEQLIVGEVNRVIINCYCD